MSAIIPAPRYSITISIAPVISAIRIFKPEKEPFPKSTIERIIFSVTTAVKNGIRAVISLIVFLAVHLVAKHDKPENKRNPGIKMLENP